MSKQTITWYQEGLKNRTRYAAELREKRDSLTRDIEQAERENKFLQFQIESAIAEKKLEFDDTRYKSAQKALFEINGYLS